MQLKVASPFELLELANGESRTFHVTAWAKGITIIKPTWFPQGKEVEILRIWVDPQQQPIGLTYWDISSKTLIAQLEPYLAKEDYRSFSYTITAFGEPPKKRYTVGVAPLVRAPGR